MKYNEILVFENTFIRRILKEDNWYYYTEDIAEIVSDFHKLTWKELKEHLDEQMLNDIKENAINLTDNQNITQVYISRGLIFRLLDFVPESKKRRRFKLWFNDITGAELVELACQNNEYIKKANEQLTQILEDENFI